MEKTQSQQNDQSKKLGFEIFKIFIVSIQFPINMIITYFYGTYLEIIICMLSFISLRYMFPKTYHSNKLSKCMTTTAIMFWLANAYMIVIGINVSILINVLIGLLLGYLAYLIQDYIDLKYRNKKFKHNRDKIIELLNGDVSQEHIFDYCKSRGIKDEVADTIDLFLHNKIDDVCEILEISDTTLKRRIKLFLKED